MFAFGYGMSAMFSGNFGIWTPANLPVAASAWFEGDYGVTPSEASVDPNLTTWAVTNAVAAVGGQTDPGGGTGAYLMQDTNDAGPVNHTYQKTATNIALGPCSFTFAIKSNGWMRVAVGGFGVGTAYVDGSTGAVGGQTGVTVTALGSVGNGFFGFRFDVPMLGGTAIAVTFSPSDGAITYQGTGSRTATIYMAADALEQVRTASLANRGTIGGTVAQATPANQPFQTPSLALPGGFTRIAPRFTANTQVLVASAAPASWTYLHDLSESAISWVFRPTADSTLMLHTTASTATTVVGFTASWTAAGGLRVRLQNGGASYTVDTSVAAAVNQTHRALFRKKPNGAQLDWELELNGVVVASGTSTVAPSASAPPTNLRIGHFSTGLVGWLPGVITIPAYDVPTDKIDAYLARWVPIWTPDLINGLVGYYDAKDAATLTLAGSSVTSWANKKAGALPALTDGGSTPRRPTYAPTGGADSKGSVNFDGVANSLQTAAYALNQPSSVVIKFRANAVTDARAVDGIATNTRAIYCGNGTDQDARIFSGVILAAPNGTWPTAAPGVIAAVFNGASSSVALNAGARTSGNAGASAASGLTVGSRAGFVAHMAGEIEWVLVYDKALTQAEVEQIYANMP
jgi:hypothetical protein